MKRLLLLMFALLVLIPLAGQYNEREILSQQAYQMISQRQFAEAERLFLQVLEKFPDDANSVFQLLNIYNQTSQLDKAENLLRQYRRILPANQATEQEILLLVMQGKPDAAWEAAKLTSSGRVTAKTPIASWPRISNGGAFTNRF